MTLDEARQNKDKRVTYRSPGGDTTEEGTIFTVNEHLVFVQFEGGVKGTRPEDLTLVQASADASPPAKNESPD